jgi:hypothetical protein
MDATARELLATEIDSETLRALRSIAERDGRPLQALVEEALADLVRKREMAEPRSRVMAAYRGSIDALGPLYEKLAK